MIFQCFPKLSALINKFWQHYLENNVTLIAKTFCAESLKLPLHGFNECSFLQERCEDKRMETMP